MEVLELTKYFMRNSLVNNWRDRQINSFNDFKNQEILLTQEYIVIDFLQKHNGVAWKWQGDINKFKNYCEKSLNITDQNHNGIIIFGEILSSLSTSELVYKIQQLISDVDFAYVGINRYEINGHDLDIELPDQIDQSIDSIIKLCDPRFRRLHTFPEVTGNHMVFVHPMDCYTLCKL